MIMTTMVNTVPYSTRCTEIQKEFQNLPSPMTSL